jgi:predicted N-formylglutamate amidohydrolase
MFTLLLTCEHARNVIPPTYRRHFDSEAAKRALVTHAGFDLGALNLARALQRTFGAQLFEGEVSRLLVELNRSAHHPKLWSKFSSALIETEKQAVIAKYYAPHRDTVSRYIASLGRTKPAVLHIGVHSFTPSLDGKVRNADIGLLYDPRRRSEQAVCIRWQEAIKSVQPALRVRRNYPYRGSSDGFTTSLRQQFGPDRYLGVELEINQALLVGKASAPARIAETISETLSQILKA